MTGFVTKKIRPKRSLGAIFKAARTKTNWTIEQAAAETKICAKYLLALENGQYQQLPAEAYNVGYVRSYAQALKLNQEKVLVMYREERSLAHAGSGESVRLQPHRTSERNFFVTPKLVGAFSALVLFGAMVGYIVWQLHSFDQPPGLRISNVPTQFTSSQDSVTLKGSTAPGATVAINQESIIVNPNGSFTQTIELSPGINQIAVTATSRADKESQRTVNVLYQQQGVALSTQNATTE